MYGMKRERVQSTIHIDGHEYSSEGADIQVQEVNGVRVVRIDGIVVNE